MSTGNADEFPAHVRPDARQITVGISEINPPGYPAQLPVNLRALPGNVPPTGRKEPPRIRARAVRVNQAAIVCRRSSRQSLARLIPAALQIDPPPGSGILSLGFRARRIALQGCRRMPQIHFGSNQRRAEAGI